MVDVSKLLKWEVMLRRQVREYWLRVVLCGLEKDGLVLEMREPEMGVLVAHCEFADIDGFASALETLVEMTQEVINEGDLLRC